MSNRGEWLFETVYGRHILNADQFPPDHPLRRQTDQIITHFDRGVDYLRGPFPNYHINKLASLFWRLVGNKVTPTVYNAEVETLHFWYERKGTETLGQIMVPSDYPDLCLQDSVMQLSALVNTASKARDYWNGRFEPLADTQARAYAYESEFLRTFLAKHPAFAPNEYETHVLTDYPQGLKSLLPELVYKSLPFSPSSRVNLS